MPAFDGTRRLEDHWRLEDDDKGKLSELDPFEPRATPEGRFLFIAVEAKEVPVPVETMLDAIIEHLGVDSVGQIELTEEQALYLLEKCQGDLPRIGDSQVLMRRGATPFIGTILWTKPVGGKNKRFELWISDTDGYGLDDEVPKTWFIVPKPGDP